ncbi:MAG: VCBS repeat-containing protein [Acidobacteriota bacterium]
MQMRSVALGIGGALVASSALATAQPVAFAARADVLATHAPRALAAADVNGDSWPDLIVGGTVPGTIAVLLNRGLAAGTDKARFQASARIAVGGGPFDLAVGDLNRDGRADIAVANADSDAVTLLFGTGRGEFGPTIDLPLDGNPRGIALGDFNRDGAPDIVVTKYMGTAIEVLYGAGDGTFPVRRQFAAPPNSQGVAVADFNDDGWPDAVVAGVSGTVTVYFSTASGMLRQNLSAAPYGWNVVTTGDFDRNGHQDIALASTAGSVVQLLYNDGGWTASAIVPVAASPRGMAAGDLNRDGRLEIAVAGRSASTVSVVSRSADGTLTTSDVTAGTGARAVAIADFDKDGRADVATANEYGDSATVLYNTTMLAPAAFAFERRDIPHAQDNRVFGVGDFDRNGTPDIVRSNGVLLNGITPSRSLGAAAGQGGSTGGAVADFNQDGRLDVVYTIANTFQVFFGDGAGGFADGPTTATAGAGSRMRAADLNRDGRDRGMAGSRDRRGRMGCGTGWRWPTSIATASPTSSPPRATGCPVSWGTAAAESGVRAATARGPRSRVLIWGTSTTTGSRTSWWWMARCSAVGFRGDPN